MLHPNVILVENEVIHGKGLAANALIRAGEVVSRLEPGQPMYLIEDVLKWSAAEQDELLIYGYQCSAEHIVIDTEPERYMNHSCDPNTWWLDDETMIARRDILPGEELTYDYATTDISIPFEMTCGCGSANCRGRVTNLDYLNPAWQAQYYGYLPMHTRKAIVAQKLAQLKSHHLNLMQ